MRTRCRSYALLVLSVAGAVHPGQPIHAREGAEAIEVAAASAKSQDRPTSWMEHFRAGPPPVASPVPEKRFEEPKRPPGDEKRNRGKMGTEAEPLRQVGDPCTVERLTWCQ